MISCRDFLQVGMVASAIVGAFGIGNWGRLAAEQLLSQRQLVESQPFGNMSPAHITDFHALLKQVHVRAPSINNGVAENKGALPHATGGNLRKLNGIADGSPSPCALRSGAFTSLAWDYGRVAGWVSVEEGTEDPQIWDVVEAPSTSQAPTRCRKTTASKLSADREILETSRHG